MIIIDTPERNTSLIERNAFLTERSEYSSPVKLDTISGTFFAIPSSIILATDINEKRISVFSFFSIYRGLICNMFFSVNNIVKWMGKQPNRNANGINNKIIQVIEYLRREGYLTLSEELNNSSSIEAIFNLSKITQECEHERFAIIYFDELNKIINYQNPNPKDAYLNSDIVLLVFAYLRMKIYRRRNKLLLEEINYDNKNSHDYDIAARKQRAPEAYNSYLYEIAEEIGVSVRIVSKAVDVLNSLDLIYYESLPRIKIIDGNKEKWRTDHTIFCNTYKREGGYLLASGKDYYLSEVENKKKKLKISK